MRVLLVDDDVDLTVSIKTYLDRHQLEVEVDHDVAAAQTRLASETFDAVLLDVLLPDMNGFEFLPILRSLSDSHVIMLTALGEEDDRVTGLNLGADDYLTKPFSARELVARLRSIRRRQLSENSAGAGLHFRDMKLTPARNRVSVGDEVVTLTGVECAILMQLMTAPTRSMSREALSRRALRREPSPLDRSLDTHVSNLRKKLGPHPDFGARIRAIRGFGYALAR
ncbi:MAG: response regulator transcription factor [Woeseiaceae bacterium]|nr:response regulator transcription factor [Woeseiaceae bacterium]